MKSTNTETKKSEILFDELGMAEISDHSLLELIAGGMATLESQQLSQADQCTNTQCPTTGH